MTRPVSYVVPSYGDAHLLVDNLEAVFAEVDRRGLGDEVIAVDDTGRDELAAALGGRFPLLRVLSLERNGGFARALLAGVEAATRPLVFSMNPDVRVRPGFLDPLVACMDEAEVFAVVPRVLLDGDEQRIESVTALEQRAGLWRVAQPGLAGDAAPYLGRLLPVAFAVGGACLMRRADFLAAGGFDPLYEPFYWEDVDLCWEAWRSGRRVLYQPASVVEHHHRGTIGRVVPSELVRAAQERNRLLFHWKHLDDPKRAEEHLLALYRMALDAWLAEERDELVWLALALEQAEAALAARSRLGSEPLSFGEALRRSAR